MARCLYVNTFFFQVLMCIILSNEVSPYEKIKLLREHLVKFENSINIQKLSSHLPYETRMGFPALRNVQDIWPGGSIRKTKMKKIFFVPLKCVFLESNKLCRLKDSADAAEVKLGKGGESSSKIILHSKYFERWSGRYAFTCKFYVRAPSDYGVYAVIQVLNFRKDEASGLCKDYVEFKIPSSKFDFFSKRTEEVEMKVCEKITASESYLSDLKELKYSDALSHSPVAENGFVAKNGVIQVTIYVAKERLDPDQKLDINLVFTSYKHDCRRREKSFQCKECEWIWEGLHMDRIQNCPYTTCLDEDFCKDIDAKNEILNVTSSGTGTKVSIGAVATIILVLVMFACCVWMSRRMQLFCFNPTASRQSRLEMNATQRAPRADDSVTPYGGMLPEATAPSAPPISEDKDLPPSYSSLFPNK